MRHSIQGVLSQAQAEGLSVGELIKLRQQGWMPPIAGADGADDDAGDHADDDVDNDDDDDDDIEDERERSGGGGGGGDDDGDDEGVKDPTAVTLSRSEHERLKRIASEADKVKKKSERDARQRAEREQKESGRWEEIIQERDERIAEIESERDSARIELDTTLRRARISSAAVRLGYKDPNDAARFLTEDDTEDDVTTERSLKRLAREKPYLVNERKASGAPVTGEGATLSVDEIKNMSRDEINRRWPEVQAAMAAGGGG